MISKREKQELKEIESDSLRDRKIILCAVK